LLAESAKFYLWLTKLGRNGNPVPRSVCPMIWQPGPASGRAGSGFPGQQADTRNVDLGRDLGVRPGESDPGRMLAGVLVLMFATIIMVLALVWWLA
jgi:hypothetical protein